MPQAKVSHRSIPRRNPDRAKVRVMVVDDSITARTVLRRLIEQDDTLSFVAQCSSAEAALERLAQIEVDVILLDLEMPGIGGLRALPSIIAAARGARVLIVSALTVDGAEQTLAALSLGAVDTFPKPTAGMLSTGYRDELMDRIRALGRKRRSRQSARPVEVVLERPRPVPVLREASRQAVQALAIGASTGGIHALGQLFKNLPERIGIPIFVTQHLPETFIRVFARQIMLVSQRDTIVAEDGMIAMPDEILIAPGDASLTLVGEPGRLRVKLQYERAACGCLPSVDPMFASLAERFGPAVMGLVLSGMGRDGLVGARHIVAAGGTVMVQDEESCAVWGMPRVVAEAGLASQILSPQQLATRVAQSLEGKK